MPGEFVHRRGR
jgi:hypothetical protein